MGDQIPWHGYIHKVERNLIWSSKTVHGLMVDLERSMQERYPGPYVLTYVHENGKLEIHPWFQDPQEELMWKLRWG